MVTPKTGELLVFVAPDTDHPIELPPYYKFLS